MTLTLEVAAMIVDGLTQLNACSTCLNLLATGDTMLEGGRRGS